MSANPIAIPYSQALQFAIHSTVGDAFLNEYGSAIRWVDCYIDLGELMAFIEDKLNSR